MPIDDYTGDKADAAANTITTPGKYIKLAVADFSDTPSNTNPATMAPTPLSSYLRLGAVEDVTKAGKTTGTVGLVTDLEGNPLVSDPKSPFNPAYDPYAPFGHHNLPADAKTSGQPLPPVTTPGSKLGTPPKGAPAWGTAAGPDPTGEDLASLVQGFADDSRNRGRPRVTLPSPTGKPKKNKLPHTPGGNADDPGTTAQGPLFGYPWVTPIPGAKSAGQLDAKDISSTENPKYTASSKPLFFPDDYRSLESSQLHTKGGWRDHTDGNRITTTRGDKVEVIRGNYKLIVLGRQDQTKPKYAGMDLSGGQSDSGGGDLTADGSTDFNQGSTAFSSLFEWRQVESEELYKAAIEDAVDPKLKAQAKKDQEASDKAARLLNDATLEAQKYADPQGYLVATINAAQQLVLQATSPAQELFASTQLAAAKKALLTAEQAVNPNLLQGYAVTVTAGTAPQGMSTTAAQATTAVTTAISGSTTAWAAAPVAAAAAICQKLDAANKASPSWVNAFDAWAAWTGNPSTAAAYNQLQADNNASTYAASTMTAAASGATAEGLINGPGGLAATNPAFAALAQQAESDNLAAATALANAQKAQAALALNPTDPTLQAAYTQAAQTYETDYATAQASAKTMTTAAALQPTNAQIQAFATAFKAQTDTAGVANAAGQAAADLAAVPTAALAAGAKKALAAWTTGPTVDALTAETAQQPSAAAATAAVLAQYLLANTAAPTPDPNSPNTGAGAAIPAGAASPPPAPLPGPGPVPTDPTQKLVYDATTGSVDWPGLDLTDAAAKAAAVAAYSAGLVEAAAIEAGFAQAPLETLQLWEDINGSPHDYRSVSSSKKGSAPKVQTKFQAGGDANKYYQEPGDGVTYAIPISGGVSINETWSYQIYNYTGIGYYPTTPPQPWPPPPPKTQTQPLGAGGGAPLAGVGLPAKTPDRKSEEVVDWPAIPQWAIYPVNKIVNKSYVNSQSSESFIYHQVSVVAGPRAHNAVTTPLTPKRTYPSDVLLTLNKAGLPVVNPDALNAPAGPGVYDRNLLTEPDMQFPDPGTLAGWISGGMELPIRDYNKVQQTWSETHVHKQATILRADTTLNDTHVISQNTRLTAGATTSYTTIAGEQHTTLHAGTTHTDSTIGASNTMLKVGASSTITTAGATSNITAVGAQSSITAAGITSTIMAAGIISSMKAALLSIDISLIDYIYSMKLGPQTDLNAAPKTKATPAENRAVVSENNLSSVKIEIGMSHTHLAVVITLG